MLHCASLLPTILASSERANERVDLHNENIFLKLNSINSVINARFLLNGHGNLYFLLHNNSVHIILLNLKKTLKFYRKEKKIQAKGVHKTFTLAAKTTLLYYHAVLNSVMFPYFFLWYCSICSTLSTCQGFSQVLLL